MASKVIRIGNSTGISVPKADLAKLGLAVGDTVTLRGTKSAVQVVKNSTEKKVDELAVKLIETYRPALEALAKR